MQDLWYAARALRRQPGFALIAILTLAVGIGASSAIYSVVDATLLRTLPFQEPHRLARVFLTQPVTPGTPFPEDAPWSYPKYETFRQLQQPFENTAVYRGSGLRLSGTDDPEKIKGEEVRYEEPPLCERCADAVGLAALAQWELEGDGE